MLRYLCALIGALVLAVAGLSTAHARGFVPEKSAHGFVTRAGGYTPGHGETPAQSCGQFVQINGFTDPKYWSAVAQYSACMVLYGPNTYVYAVTNVEFPAQCPAWSTKSGAGCTCDAGFKPDASRLECVPYDVKGPAQPEMCPVPGKSAPQDGAFIGNPILGATGEKRITELDYADGTAHGLTLVRTWRSAQEPLGEAARSAGLGPQWNHNHNVSLVRDGIPVGMYRNGKFFAIHSDHLGTPRLITNEARAVVWQWPYSAFGNNKPTGVLKATANPKQALTIQPVLLKATAPIEFNHRMPGQYADVETGLFYNYHRNMNSLTGRYMQSDPIGLDGGLNPYQYAESNPLKYTDPLGLYTEVVVWQGVGIGSSSFGHVSTNVNGQNFSWGPGGWDKQSATAAEYNKRQQDFRGGTGVMLNLSPQQEAALASCMRASTAAYSAISNNCGNPVQQCLNAVGAGVGNSVMPSSILENLRSSPNSNGNVSYPSPRPSSGFGGGLLWR